MHIFSCNAKANWKKEDEIVKMEELIIRPTGRLSGTVSIDGSKNAALPILAASLLMDTPTQFKNVPNLSDTKNMLKILHLLGAKTKTAAGIVEVDAQDLSPTIVPNAFTARLRASFLVAGPLLARVGQFRIALPGGCKIGTRPINLHLKGFKALGAEIETEHGFIKARAQQLRGANIYLDFPSVGATENLLMAATLAKGTTVLENAATEPEIVDLAEFLKKAGAVIQGAGTDTITVLGVPSLFGTTHKIIPDRIETGTFMLAAAVTGGRVEIQNAVPEHVKALSAKLREIGVFVTEKPTSLLVEASGELCPANIKTLPFPGFPTDLQAPLCTLLCKIHGTSIITETVFENRFMYVNELKRMGADITVEGHAAIIKGTQKLSGAHVCATDLRAGAALILAGLFADGETHIKDYAHIKRGYAALPEKLCRLGADITLTAAEDYHLFSENGIT